MSASTSTDTTPLTLNPKHLFALNGALPLNKNLN